MELDRFDLGILAALQRDGALTNAALSGLVNLSASQCSRRRAALEEAGVIEGYSVRLNAGKLQRALLIFVEVTLDRTSARVFEDFGAAVRRTPEIMECHMVAGGFDYLIKVRVRDMAAYRHFLGTVLVGLPGIRQTHTYTVMEEVKNTTEFAID